MCPQYDDGDTEDVTLRDLRALLPRDPSARHRDPDASELSDDEDGAPLVRMATNSTNSDGTAL